MFCLFLILLSLYYIITIILYSNITPDTSDDEFLEEEMEESRWTCVVCGEREEYDCQLHLAEVLAELVAVCRKGRIWLQCMLLCIPAASRRCTLHVLG